LSTSIYKVLIYISILILCLILYQIDYLRFPAIHSIPTLVLSFLFLFAGFLVQAYSWRKTLAYGHCKTSFKDSLISIGSTIFSKYIPGKVWVIVGRAAYISSIKKEGLSKLTIISLNAQLITLWTGLVFGLSGLIMQNDLKLWGLLGIIFFFLLTPIIFTPFFHKFLLKIFYTIFKKEIELSALSYQKVLLLLPWYGAYWFLWTTGFYLMVTSFSSSHVDAWVALAFPLASTLGIISVFAPGGLGVREGIMVGYILLSDLSLQEASVIAVIARLWFLLGEIAIFLFALLLHYGYIGDEEL